MPGSVSRLSSGSGESDLSAEELAPSLMSDLAFFVLSV